VLLEQETQLSTTNRATHLHNMQWHGWPPGNTPLPYVCYPAGFVVLGQSVITEICLKNMIHRIPPFKVTQDHRNRHGSIGVLWLSIDVL